jgi:hypothetical protein
MFHDPLLTFQPNCLGPIKGSLFSKNDLFFFSIQVSDEEINNSSTAEPTFRDGIAVTCVLHSYTNAGNN